eukprot:scaffold14279_cov91-Skeletonema_marinoi.AAC.3
MLEFPAFRCRENVDVQKYVSKGVQYSGPANQALGCVIAGYSNFNRHGEDYFPLVKFGQTQKPQNFNHWTNAKP